MSVSNAGNHKQAVLSNYWIKFTKQKIFDYGLKLIVAFYFFEQTWV